MQNYLNLDVPVYFQVNGINRWCILYGCVVYRSYLSCQVYIVWVYIVLCGCLYVMVECNH